jgi:predicted Zn-dependent protease
MGENILSYLSAALFVIMNLVSCETTPVTERKQVILVSDEQMDSLGEQSYKEILQKEKISQDKAMTAKIVSIGQAIAKASGEDYKWEFNLIDSDAVNAFCLPGGKVGVYTGILKVAQSNAGLAAVMGHEVAHAVAKHGAERVSQGLIVQGALGAVDIAMKDERNKDILLGALGIGAQFGVLMPYGRKHESEADRIGLIYMAKAGFDPREAVELWKRMAANGSGGMPEFLSTHPDPLKRAAALESQLKDVMPIYEASKKIPTTKL